MKLLLLLLVLALAEALNGDRFNYGSTNGRDFGPLDWDQVTCDDLAECTGWPDDWIVGIDWELQENTCLSCPVALQGSDSQPGFCRDHHQSPIALTRKMADENEEDYYHLCEDRHWMKYEDSSCLWSDLERTNSFTIERHALRINQPIEYGSDWGEEDYRLACPTSEGRKFGRIDYSWGFNDWWFLSHTDIKIPSEHTQNGKRYDAEVQMAHFFSLAPQDARYWNEMATVSIFLQAYEDHPPYAHLDRLICEWRRAEHQTRAQCGLSQVAGPYPGCFTPNAPGETDEQNPFADSTWEQWANGIDEEASIAAAKGGGRRKMSMANAIKDAHGKHIPLESINYRDADMTDDEFAEWIQAYSDNDRGQSSPEQRKLIEGQHNNFHNYQFLIDCKTEYYHRYHGTQTVPPCYGAAPDDKSHNGDTNHWRVMKDPVRIHPRQLAELQRLMRSRVASPGDVHNPCQEGDTATIVSPETGNVWGARPLQSTDGEHQAVFCWCPQWPSKWPEDREWCEQVNQDQADLLDDVPYNFHTNNF